MSHELVKAKYELELVKDAPIVSDVLECDECPICISILAGQWMALEQRRFMLYIIFLMYLLPRGSESRAVGPVGKMNKESTP